MDLVYSLALFIALFSGGLGVLMGILLLAKRLARARIRLVYLATALGLASLVISVVVHWSSGHGPAGVEPMGILEFVSAHPAFLVASLIILSAIAIALHEG